MAKAGPSGLNTRCAMNCPVFGQPSQLPENVLPTYEQIIKFCAWIRNVEKQPQMRIQFITFAKTCDRHGISDRSAAALASAVLNDIGVVTPEDSSQIVDRSKVRRERQKTRFTLRLQELNVNVIRVHRIYFDGDKDKTLAQET
ncbi:hypothetical protein RN001_007219 [Aquatica leii]|uniref:Uncharacterized protein n=1 Tax=Aquatica leii TaxID=1421715 RepID=A0AAN7SNS8_9COLE|nr:hypothetical protein RN001_007219 [Aquatica leii]